MQWSCLLFIWDCWKSFMNEACTELVYTTKSQGNEPTFLSTVSTPVVPWLSFSPLDPRFAGSNPAGLDGFFQNVKILRFTAVKQVVACVLVTQRALVWSPIATDFLGEVFSGFFFTCQETFRPPKVPDYHLAVVIIIPYSPCWDDWVCAWRVLSFMFVLSRRWPRHWADHIREALHVLVW